MLLRGFQPVQAPELSAQALELAHKVDTVAFDKTGTLTVGQPQLTAIHAFDNWSEPQLLAAVAAVQRGSEHPLADAIVRAARAQGLALQAVEDFE